jgi:hypothetical protein
MLKFISDHPGFFQALMSGVISFTALLLGLYFRSLTVSIRDLTTEMRAVRKEFKDDRESDRQIWGSLLDRMQKQETICEQHREHCPWENCERGL